MTSKWVESFDHYAGCVDTPLTPRRVFRGAMMLMIALESGEVILSTPLLEGETTVKIIKHGDGVMVQL